MPARVVLCPRSHDLLSIPATIAAQATLIKPIYGIMSYTVGRRTTEIGVHMALGAQPSAVLAMILQESLALALAGIAVGIPVALASAHVASSVLSDLLFGIKPADPFSFALAIATIFAVALLAGYFPARSAARIDPMAALRSE